MSSALVSIESLKALRDLPRRALKRIRDPTVSQNVLLFLIAFRILNALTIKTFFQPDEFFQSLEPAWEIAFGAESGAWITWEWRNQLRSAVFPTTFASVYWASSRLCRLLRLSPDSIAEVLIAAPKVTQAVFAAVGDYYTWKLGEKVYGQGSNEAWTVLALTVCSPWQWFCSTRTLSNCLETTYTIVALEKWPWRWSLHWKEKETTVEESSQKEENKVFQDELLKLHRCLILAAWACIFRPTNILIWICIACFSLLRTRKPIQSEQPRRADRFAVTEEKWALLRKAAHCGCLVLTSSAIADRYYYQQWTFPPYRFLYFNIAQSLAVFYGRNDWHYYLTQGYPLLLTTFLPFGITGLYQAIFPKNPSSLPSTPSRLSQTIKFQLGTTAIIVPLILSFVSHKEVRFINPILPILHILAASPLSTFFSPLISSKPPKSQNILLKRNLLILLLTTSFAFSLFITTSYQTAPISVMSYLRSQYTTYYLSQPPTSSGLTKVSPQTMTVGFLMPCHSTPWRSHLVHPGIKAWALTCEPPLSTPPTERADYLDEADQFYASPKDFLYSKLGDPPLSPSHENFNQDWATDAVWDAEVGYLGTVRWPEYLVFFGQMEGTMREVLAKEGEEGEDGAYGECWRGWNGVAGWHEDWRRRGGLVVWCLRRKEWRGLGHIRRAQGGGREEL